MSSKTKDPLSRKELTALFSNSLMSFCLLFTFAATLSNVVIATHNLHGFKTSSAYHKSCINSHGGVWMCQEHWLSESQIPLMQNLGCQFFARSGMEEAISSGIYRGRPFGGVGIAWSSNLDQSIVPLTSYKHKRVAAAELKLIGQPMILICVYMPFYDSSRREECLNETIDAISMVEVLIAEHPNHLIVIGGDLNTELQGQSPFDCHWNNLMSKHQLSQCDDRITSPRFTYHHESLGQRKFNDHFIVSKSLLRDGTAHSHEILEDGDNNSDHLPLLMKLSAQLSDNIESVESSIHSRTVNWTKLTSLQKSTFTDMLQELLEERPSSFGHCNHSCSCNDDRCKLDIQVEYDKIISCLKEASQVFPRRPAGAEKDWWTPELTQLRDQSISINSLWISEGRPKQGPTHQERLRVRADYKRAIRWAKKMPKQNAWDKLHSSMESQDSGSFWKWWRSIYSKRSSEFSTVVDGCNSKKEIANVFKGCFLQNAKPNNTTRVDQLNDQFKNDYESYSQQHKNNCNCADFQVNLNHTIDAICSMKLGKSADDDGIQAEHFLNGPFVLLTRLTKVFNSMLAHGFVPSQFHFGTIVPLVKDRHGNKSDSGNYRGITLSPIPSKIFERVLKAIFSRSLTTSSYQFGFKSKSSTADAIFCLKETINYYIDHGSRTYCSFLDASKAFDRLVHAGLFIKLIQRNIPKSFLDVIIMWYSQLQCRVKWDGHFSDWFDVTAGVRQGGVLSPDFYNIYVDGLVDVLISSGVGCYVSRRFAALLLYADDMVILAPSLKSLQKLLNLCESYCKDWDICLNPKKTKNMCFGRKCELPFRPKINGIEIDWVDQWRYLGVDLKSAKRFDCAVTEKVKSFYRCLNSILRVEGRSNDMVLLRLIEAHCIPILTYGIETIHVADRDACRSLRVAYNSVYRKIFHYRQYESVTDLQHSLDRLTWEELVQERTDGFLKRAHLNDSSSLIRAFC